MMVFIISQNSQNEVMATLYPSLVNSATGGVPMGYDSRAELTSYAGWSYTFDAKGQLLTAVNGSTGGSVQFVYDPLGRRTRRYVNGVLQRIYHYDGWRVVEERDGNNHKVYSYLYGAQGELMERVAANGAPTWYHHDARGFVTHLTGGDATVLEQYLYDAYGGVYVLDAAGNQRPGNVSACDNHFLWADGYEWQPELGLYLCGHRFYSPKLGRWLSPDPSGMGGGDNNWSRYCNNDPVNGYDPSGLLEEDDQPKYADGGGGDYTPKLSDIMPAGVIGPTGPPPIGSHIPEHTYITPGGGVYDSGTGWGSVYLGSVGLSGGDNSEGDYSTPPHDRTLVVTIPGYGGGVNTLGYSNNNLAKIANVAYSNGDVALIVKRNQIDITARYIADNYSECDNIIIVGYSRGAVGALELASALNGYGTEVNTLVTLDPVRLFGNEYTVPSNVVNAYNFFQTNGGIV